MSEYRRYSMECKEFRAMLDNAKQKVSDYDFYRTDEAKEKAILAVEGLMCSIEFYYKKISGNEITDFLNK